MMDTWQQTAKLVELRSKTDRQLVEFVTRTLEAAMCLARTGDDHARAERACDQVRHLLPALPKADRRRLEARLAEVAEELRPTAHAACF
jgi:hypothetical protein